MFATDGALNLGNGLYSVEWMNRDVAWLAVGGEELMHLDGAWRKVVIRKVLRTRDGMAVVRVQVV